MTMIVLLSFVVPKYADADSVKRLIQTADEKGYAHSRIANFGTLSHNAEFYGNGRLIRNADGTQIRFDDPGKLVEEQQKTRTPLLVLVPSMQVDRLPVPFGAIADNGRVAIVAIDGN